MSFGLTPWDPIQSGGQTRIWFPRRANAWILISQPGVTPASSTRRPCLEPLPCRLVIADMLMGFAPDVAGWVTADRAIPAAVMPKEPNGDVGTQPLSPFACTTRRTVPRSLPSEMENPSRAWAGLPVSAAGTT